MKTKGANSFDNFFSEPVYYDEHGYVFKSNTFNQQQAEEYFVNWLMDEWQWLPRENKKYVYREVRKNISNGFVKWHGFIDDDGEMHNGWVLYREWRGGQKRFRHVYVVDFQKHYLEHGHHFEPILSDWGMPRGHNDRDCFVCNQLKLAKLQGSLDALKQSELLMLHPSTQEGITELEKEIGYYDSYK